MSKQVVEPSIAGEPLRRIGSRQAGLFAVWRGYWYRLGVVKSAENPKWVIFV
jgi:hypothetical protein